MTLDLDAIEARASAATPGPWSVLGDEYVTGPPTGYEGEYEHPPDAAFLAHAREDVPALVAEVRRLRQFVAQEAEDERARIVARLRERAEVLLDTKNHFDAAQGAELMSMAREIESTVAS